MRRREFVQAMVVATVAPGALFAQQAPTPPPSTGLPAPAPVPWMTGLNAKTPLPETEPVDAVAQADPQFFTPTQMATLSCLSGFLLPPVAGRPGAVEAGTPAFLDFLVGESPEDRKAMYTGGLDWLDEEAKKEFSLPFAKLQAQQADHLLRPWLRTWMPDHLPTEVHADFINSAHSDIRTATVNSLAWNEASNKSTQERPSSGLYWFPVEPDLYGERVGHRVSAEPQRK